jgi:hypothetical protein
MRTGRLISTVFTGALASVVFATAAYAKTTPLNPAQIGLGADFQVECEGPLASPPGPNYDGWHFVLPAATGDDFTSVTIVFSGGVTAGPITALSPAQNSGPGWVGFLDDAGNSGDVKHAYIFTTPVGQKIVSGTAEVSGEGTQNFFNLSHGCPGMASPSPSASPSTSPSTSPSASASTSTPKPSGAAETGGGGSFGVTGVGIGALALAGGAGVALIMLRRRNESE